VTRRMIPEQFDLERFFDYAIDMLCIADETGYFLKVNRAFERVFGYTREELLARPFVEFVHPDDRAETIAETRRLSTGDLCFAYENRYRAKDGSWKHVSWTCYPDPETGLMYAVARDMTHEREREDWLDGITGVPNRRVFDETAEEELRRAHRMRIPLSLALLDVDHLRAFNQAVGHLEGDRTLRHIAETMATHMRRAGDFLARYNGGTFGLLLPGAHDQAASIAHCETVRATVGELDLTFTEADGATRQLTMSGGLVTRVPDRSPRATDFTGLAEEALRRAKARGRNRLEAV